MDLITSSIDFKSFDSSSRNFVEFSFKIRRLSSGPPSGKLAASYFPTLAPDGAAVLPRYWLSEITSTSIVLVPLLL